MQIGVTKEGNTMHIMSYVQLKNSGKYLVIGKNKCIYRISYRDFKRKSIEAGFDCSKTKNSQ